MRTITLTEQEYRVITNWANEGLKSGYPLRPPQGKRPVLAAVVGKLLKAERQ